MPPTTSQFASIIAHQARSATSIQPYLSAESSSWKNPDDILSILMLVGGDIVQEAVAQLVGAGPWGFTPVAFSFGWLAYSVTALTSALGDGRLMPQPDYPAQVTNAKTSYARENASWILGRLLRDHEKRVLAEIEKKHVSNLTSGGLTIAFYRTTSNGRSGIPSRDLVYWSGVAVIAVQFGISIIPGTLHGNWIVLIVTFGGILLALATSAQAQWRDEKYAARRVGEDKQREVACVTRGNGSGFAMVVISGPNGLRLEDLASGRDKQRSTTLAVSVLFCILWIVLLLTVEGIVGDRDAWYLLAIGGLGMVQNVFAAGRRRSAGALGFHFDSRKEGDIVRESKVMDALKRAEEKEAGVGLCLLTTFFPGELRPDEERYWNEKRQALKEACIPWTRSWYYVNSWQPFCALFVS
ncbi:hypothetical protein C8Q78DRAFT_1066467 [Trametes maxima]|nr:hypothetical protein C8Q78DRAFT_1066467 [Trametes maxima]